MGRRLKNDEVAAFFAALEAENPHPEGELNYSNPFTLLVAVVLSAQSTDVGVNKATKELFEIADTPEKMLALGEAEVRNHIKTIGLYRNKAKNVIKLSQQLIDNHNSHVPESGKDLEALAGVGRKTANVVRNIAFGHPTLAVDTHVFRVANRTGLVRGKTPLEVEVKLVKRIPKAYMQHAHHWLILHGRYTCIARKPKCHACPVAHICTYEDKTLNI